MNWQLIGFVYDVNGRQSGGALPAYSARYQYDAVGNRTYSIVDGVHTAYTVDANDRLLQQGGDTYTYDAAGNTLTHTRDGQVTTYAYDARQRLLRTQGPAGSAQYGYDADGNRIQKTEGGQRTQYLIDSVQDHAQVVAELANGTPQVRYTLGDERLSQQDAGGTFRFYETDGHGSVRALTDGVGAVTDTYAYDALGTLLQQTGSAANDFRYTGEQFDAASGLYYLRARHYSPHSGRFTQRDTWEGNSQDPITLHKYVYGNSDPVTHIDPSGRFSLVEMGVTQTIRTELTSLQIDSGFSLLDRITDGQSQQITGPLAQANQALMLGVAAIGGVQMLKMLSRKFRSKCGGNSFDGETLVHTRQGLRPIREIRIGDEVLAFNEATGQEEYSPVVHLIRSDKEQGWVDVTTAGGEVIRATAEHPFYAKSANDPSWQWMDAAELLQGLELYTARNGVEAVAGTRDYLAQRPAYNLTVDRTHTYFVGKDGVLVHNSRGCVPHVLKVDNIHQFFESNFGSVLRRASSPTSRDFHNQRIFKVSQRVDGLPLKKGDLFYLDGLHKDHLEVFDKTGRIRTVLNLDGTPNLEKLAKAIEEGRRLPASLL